jgi:hypothetical protein
MDAKQQLDEALKQKIRDLVFDTHAHILMDTPVAESTPGNEYIKSHTGGALRRSIAVEEVSDGWIIGSTLEYAEYVELGTNPHEIHPKDKQALAFYNKKGNNFVVTGKVNHPGTEGQHMFLKGVNYFESKRINL